MHNISDLCCCCRHIWKANTTYGWQHKRQTNHTQSNSSPTCNSHHTCGFRSSGNGHSCWIRISRCFRRTAFILQGSGVQPQSLIHKRNIAISSSRIMIFYISKNCKSGERLGYFNFFYVFYSIYSRRKYCGKEAAL